MIDKLAFIIEYYIHIDVQVGQIIPHAKYNALVFASNYPSIQFGEESYKPGWYVAKNAPTLILKIKMVVI